MRTNRTAQGWTVYVALVFVGCPTFVWAQGGDFDVVEVREEWELMVGQPNPTRNAPQVTMIMSPYANLDQDYFSFVLNHRVAPAYFAGGMQVLRYNGHAIRSHQNGVHQLPLTSSGETIRWRQRLSAADGQITFQVDQGTSTSWGGFGGQGQLTTVLAGGPANLNEYRPQMSFHESGIGYGGNRVESLTLTRLEWHLSDGRVVVFEAPIDIDSDLDPWD